MRIPAACAIFLAILPLYVSLLSAEEDILRIEATAKDRLTIGRLAELEIYIHNLSDKPVVILELLPSQPCEEPIKFVNPVYGSISYDERRDHYIHDSLTQSPSTIPVLSGYILADSTLKVPMKYRPFSRSEKITAAYAYPGDAKTYSSSEERAGKRFFRINRAPKGEVIIPMFHSLEKRERELKLKFSEISGEETPGCYCEAVGDFASDLPPALCKDWDSGEQVLFRVGEKQEEVGPEERSAGWKFLNRYPVYFGDGMHTHGEFVRIPASEAGEFVSRIAKKYSIKKITYHFSDHYFDLEPLP